MGGSSPLECTKVKWRGCFLLGTKHDIRQGFSQGSNGSASLLHGCCFLLPSYLAYDNSNSSLRGWVSSLEGEAVKSSSPLSDQYPGCSSLGRVACSPLCSLPTATISGTSSLRHFIKLTNAVLLTPRRCANSGFNRAMTASSQMTQLEGSHLPRPPPNPPNQRVQVPRGPKIVVKKFQVSKVRRVCFDSSGDGHWHDPIN